MKIVKLIAENVKRLKAIEITPEGHMVTIGGKNDQGKSTAIDCIDMAFSGKKSIPPEPIRKGEESAKIVVETEDLIVTRTFTLGGGGSLRVGTKDGKFYTGPQGVLDPLVGQLAFDPLSFMRKKPTEQIEALKKLTGLDFTKLEEEKGTLYARRTSVNSAGKATAGALASLPQYPKAPKEKVSVSDLMVELQRREAVNDVIKSKEVCLINFTRDLKTTEAEIESIKGELGRLEANLLSLNNKKKAWQSEIKKQQGKLGNLKAENIDKIKEQIASAEGINMEVEANRLYNETNEKVEALRGDSKKLSDKLAALDHKQKMQLATAKFPIKGLSFDENNVYFNEIPFEQLSTSEKLKVSASMGFAMNPSLRVLLIREGASLDTDNRKLLAEMAKENDTQVFLEIVGGDKDTSVIIEDGRIKEMEEDSLDEEAKAEYDRKDAEDEEVKSGKGRRKKSA